MLNIVRLVLPIAVGLLLATGSGSVEAHIQSRSFSSWQIADSGLVSGTFTVSAIEASRLGSAGPNGALERLLLSEVESAVSVHAAGENCPSAAAPRTLASAPGQLRVELRFQCTENAVVTITNEAFFDAVPTHVHYARMRAEGGGPIERLFTSSVRSQEFGGGATNARPAYEPVGSYLLLGIAHILAGADHLAFLLALLLSCRRLREMSLLVTGFTLGHSVTLSLAALGLVRPESGAVEALIGYSIALVAAENVALATGGFVAVATGCVAALAGMLGVSMAGVGGLTPVMLLGLGLFSCGYLFLDREHAAGSGLRALLTMLFGLVHGFGFAGVLLDVGLPAGRMVSALFAFNLGVELGQVLVVACLWIVGRALVRRGSPAAHELGFDLLSASLGAVGVFWFVHRAF